MHVVRLDVHRPNGPSILGTVAANLLLKKRGNLAHENLFPVFGTPDKVVSQFVGNMFGVLCIHTLQYNKCSKSCKIPVWAALPLDES